MRRGLKALTTTIHLQINSGKSHWSLYITVNKGSNEPIKVEFEEGPSHSATYTEVEVALPIGRFIEDKVRKVEQYYKIYKIGKGACLLRPARQVSNLNRQKLRALLE